MPFPQRCSRCRNSAGWVYRAFVSREHRQGLDQHPRRRVFDDRARVSESPLNGGADKALPKDDKAITFQLRPLERVFHDPATALGITGIGFISKDEDDELVRDYWEQPLIAARDTYAAHLARTAPNPRFAGVIPVTFFMENAKVILHSQRALYRPKNHADDAPVGERMAAAFYDLHALCVRSVCFGLVLRDSANPMSAPFPDVGSLMREKKKWA
ncbi:hypothetical protein LXA43DRAFT_1102549 [Ganoderma leucocontextum]|nr:hypothetical protein LXA43DRAFT_1102549 [Ganoderma leucocontextum]